MQTIIRLDSTRIEEFIDLTKQIESLVRQSGVDAGLVHLFCRHTTAALTVNENYDPDVKRDLLLALHHAVPENQAFEHAEGNSSAHMKAALLGHSLTVPVQGGRLALGRWQGLLFAEFDGPREGREVMITIHSVQ